MGASIRRKDLDIEGTAEDFDPNEASQYFMRLLEEVKDIVVNGYTKRTVTITGRSVELEDLASELATWTPAGGWSEDAKQLFAQLRGEA